MMTPLFISPTDELAVLIAAIFSQYLYLKQADLLAYADAAAMKYFGCDAKSVFRSVSFSRDTPPGPAAAMCDQIAINHNAIKGALYHAN